MFDEFNQEKNELIDEWNGSINDIFPIHFIPFLSHFFDLLENQMKLREENGWNWMILMNLWMKWINEIKMIAYQLVY